MWKGHPLTRYSQNCLDLYVLVEDNDLTLVAEGLKVMWEHGREIHFANFGKRVNDSKTY